MAACLVGELLCFIGATRPAAADTIVAGTAGNDTALPKTDSAVTVDGTGAFAKVKFTINQTKNLVNQAVSVTWTGATPSVNPNQPYYDHFMQIMECWGNDDGTNPADPGPPPSQCEFGVGPEQSGNPANLPSEVDARYLGVFASSAEVPFDAVDGTVVPKEEGTPPNADQFHQLEWLNPYYDETTSNEDAWAKVFPDGTGSELFQVDTGLEAPGLGCGQQVEPGPNNTMVVPKCWLVIVPRSDRVTENGGNTSLPAVETSPLSPGAWANRISVPLDFNPVGSACNIGANQTRLVGSELAGPAISSWQPALCSLPSSPPYSFAPIADTLARQQLVAGVSGMAVVSRPLGADTTPSSAPVTYAPLTLSGLVIGFNVERQQPPGQLSAAESAAEQPLLGSRVQNLNLTPLLVAKLLTESYKSSVAVDYELPSSYTWAASNPGDLTEDADFLRYNPEFKDLGVADHKEFASLVVEESSSDSAHALWSWILADPAARAWLAGGADGNTPPMKVNPVYSFLGDSTVPIPESFPKADPYCYQDTSDTVGSPPQPPRPLCQLDWSPYAGSMRVAAQETEAANIGAKLTKGTLNPSALTPDTFWVSDGPDFEGSRSILSVTDSASAARYGIQSANLSRAGDDASPTFIAPTQGNLVAGEQTMVASADDPTVLQPNPSTTSANAYPLTLLTYAAVAPSTLDATTRNNYAAFIDYAAGSGQVGGLQFGDLPPGYAPLTSNLVTQAQAAATAIRNYTTPTTSTGTPASVPASSVGRAGASAAVSSSGSPSGSVSGAGAPSTTAQASSGKTPSTPATSPIQAILHTIAEGVGMVRYILPLSVALGTMAAVGAVLLEWNRRQHLGGSRPPPEGPGPL